MLQLVAIETPDSKGKIGMSSRLTLKNALETSRLEDFIAEQEAVVPPANRAEFEAALEATIKPLQPEDRTLRSASRGGSSGK